MMKKIAELKNYFSRHLKLTPIFIAVLFLNSNLFAAEYIWSERADSSTHGPYVWDYLDTLNNESIWKKHDGNQWQYLDATPVMTADDNIFFSSEVVSSVILTKNISVNDIICSYVVDGVVSRDLPITINLNGYQLDCKNLILGNSATLGANLIFIDEAVANVPRGPLNNGVVNVTGSFDYADNANNTLSLNDNIAFNFSGTYNKAADGSSGSLVLLGDGTASASRLSDEIAADPEANANAVWTGAAGTKDWATLGNWSGIANISQLENAKTVTIPAGKTLYPEASTETSVTLNGKLIIGDGASVTFNGNVRINSITLGTGTIIKFNQGTGDQTTTITTFTFGGKEIAFGNSSGDVFDIGSGALDISSADNATFGGSITAGSFKVNSSMNITAETVINPQVTLTGNLTVTDNGSNTVMFQNGIAGDYDFTSNANSTWFRGDVNVKSVNITGETQFLGSTNSITTTGTQSYVGNIVTNRDISLIAGENEISIEGTVNAWNSANAARSLIIGNASKATSLKIKGKIGGGPDAKEMNNVTVYGNLTASGSMVIAGSVSVKGTTTFEGAAPLTINSKNTQTYTGAVSLNQNVTFLAGTNAVTFESTVNSDSAKNLICGNDTTETPVIFKGNVGVASPIGDLSFYGPVTLNGSIKTTGSQIFKNTITLTGDSELKGPQLNLPENVNLDAESSNHKLTLTSPNIQGSSITFAPEVKVSAQDTIIKVTGTATFNKALSGNEGNDFKVDGNGIFSSTVDSFKDFAVTGNGSFAGDFGTTGAINSLKVAGTTSITNTSIKTTATQTYSDDILITTNATLTATEVILNKADAVDPATEVIQNVSGTNLTLDTPTVTVSQKTNVTAPVELAKDVEIGGTKAITFGGATGTAGKNITVTGDVIFNGITVSSPVINNNSVTCTGDVTFADTYATATGKTGTFNASAGTVTFNANVDFSRNTFVSNNGTIVLDPSPSGTTIILGGSNTYNTVQIKGDVDIIDTNTFATLSASGLENKTITFPATVAKVQNVTTKLILTGVSNDDNKRLLLRSDSANPADATTDCFYINFTGTVDDTNYSIKFVDMQNGYNAREDGSSNPDYLRVKDSIDSGNNYYWNFPGATYNWTGATDTDWFTPANWYPKSVPGMGTKVIISSSFNSNPVEKFPSIDEDAITLGNSGNLSGSITINDGAMIDFQDATITVGEIVNHGKVYSLGINEIGGTKNNGDAINGYGTVIYYGEGITTASWGENYYNLWFGDRDDSLVDSLQSDSNHKLSAGEIPTKLDVSGTLVINNNSDGKTLTLSSNQNNFAHSEASSVKNNPIEIDSENENVVLNSNGTLIINGNASCNSLEISEDVTIKGKVKTKAAQTYNGNVILADDVTLTAGTGSAIKIEKNAGTTGTGTSDYALILDGNVIFGTDAKINSKYVMPSPSQNSSWALANPADGKVINIATDIFCDFDSSKTLTIKNDLTCKNFIAYSGTITVAADKTLATSADFVAFGLNYSGDDPRYSGTDTRFAYYFGAEPSYKPAGTTYSDHILTGITSSVASAVLTAGTESKIKTGNNFYVNGLPLSGFTLELNSPTSNPTLNTTAKATPNQWGTPYAVVFNSTITNVKANGNSNETYLTAAAAQNNIDGNGNTNVQFKVPQITKAYTVYDDVIYIAFNIPIENSNGDINTKLEAGKKLAEGGMYYNNKTLKFAGAYEDADCTRELPDEDITTADSDGNYGFYVKTNEKWNTDAYGKNKWNPDAETSGTTEQSTDRNGIHHDVTVDLSFLEGVFVAANGFTMSDNYGIGNQADGTDAPVYDATEDKCAPVLVAVLTGKEKHIAPSGEASIPATEAEAQQVFDGHNFIEFRYSEPVDIGTMKAAEGKTNVGSSELLGNIQTMGTGITVKGLATIASGSVTAASKLGGTTPVHSLYRKFSKTFNGTFDVQTHSVRVAIAGYVNGTVSSNGKSYYNWTSYIESAVMPSGAVTRIATPQVKDKAGNPVTIEKTTNHPLTQLYVNQIKNAGAGAGGADVYTDIETDSLYNKWDVTPPSFAPLRYNGFTDWKNLKNPNDSTKYEALGAAYSGSTTLNAIEFHMFDNTPAYVAGETEQWFTKIGWAKSSDDKNVSGSAIDPAADTRGGIRYCTIYNLTNKFTYLRKGDASICNFENSKNISGGAESSIFVAPENSKSTGIEDGCYFKVPLTDASGHDPKSEFQIYFDAEDSSVYVTDLAGNLLKKELYTLNTVDRSSPSVNVTAAPCGKDEMYIVFSKAINIDEIIGHTKDNKDEVKLNALECIPKALTISGATDLKIDDSVPARVVHRTENATGFILKLTRPITIDDIKGGFYIELKESAEYPYDSLSGINAKVTLVQDMAGNYADAGKQHALTDFAINVIEPEFAHNSNMLDSNGDDVQFGLYSEGSWAVHSWGRDQGNYGTLNPEYDVFMRVQDPYDLLAGKTDTLFLSNNPTDKSVSYEYNRISGRNWRIWLPQISANISPVANDNVIKLDGNADGTDPHIINYDIKLLSDSATYDGYDAGTTITFLFDTKLTVKHDGSTSDIESPLYALRLSDPNDVSSLDLWSIKLKSITAQRGGVSILNNVINPLNGEKAVLRLNMASAGSVNIMVMTLDGNIVTYLNRGQVESGEQFFTWDGKNTSGKVVARGMYFIRVMGNGIDETRKVMIVK